jgi:aspartate/methionine/tyrosine aminotransferase
MDSGMFQPLQMAAAKALSLGADWYSSINSIYSQRRDQVYRILDLLGCSYELKQVGLFVWAKIPDRYQDAYALSDEILYGANVFLTPGGIFGSQGNRYIRISLCGDLSRFEQAITRISKSIK